MKKILSIFAVTLAILLMVGAVVSEARNGKGTGLGLPRLFAAPEFVGLTDWIN